MYKQNQIHTHMQTINLQSIQIASAPHARNRKKGLAVVEAIVREYY